MVESCPGWIDFLFQTIGKAILVRLFRDVCLGLFLTILPSYWTVMGLGQATPFQFELMWLKPEGFKEILKRVVAKSGFSWLL